MCNLCRCRHLLSHNQYKVHTVHPFGGRWRFDIAIIYSYDFCFFQNISDCSGWRNRVSFRHFRATHSKRKNLHAKSERDNCMIQNPTKPKLTLLTTQSPPLSLPPLFSSGSLLGATPSLCAACEYRLSCRLVSRRIASHRVSLRFFFLFFIQL